MTTTGGRETRPDAALDALVLDARDALARSAGGTLHLVGTRLDVSGCGPDTSASFYDDGGVPTFFAPADSPVVAAARAGTRAVLSVPLGPGAVDGADTLVLAGCLEACREEEAGAVVVVTLRLSAVVLERDTPPAPVSHRMLPLGRWASADPDPVRRTARQLVEHTNDAHAGELRRFVAGLRGVGEHDVVAAEIADLDAAGFDLRWIDERGAHTLRVRFPHSAGCPGSLVTALRSALLS
ncbi:DUF2470 domain-containing protein [Jatrophihabitans fulvus]